MKRISLPPVFDYELTTATDAFFRRFKLCSVLKRANAYKFRRISAVTVSQVLFNLVFNKYNRSLFMELKTGTYSSKAGKDTFYSFINSYSVNWMRFTSLPAERIINRIAYVTVVFARYMMFAIENRSRKNERTFVEIHCLVSNEFSDFTWLKVFRLLMEVFISTVSDRSLLTEKELDVLLEIFIRALPKMLKNKLLKWA